jgi:hypothetical protein
MYQMSIMGFRLQITYPVTRKGLMDADAIRAMDGCRSCYPLELTHWNKLTELAPIQRCAVAFGS